MGSDVTAKPQVNKLTIVIVGEGGVGKSSLTLQFVQHKFFESYDPTIDDSYVTTVMVDGAPWQIEVLDTAGQEEYRDLWVEHAITQGEAFIVTYAINSTRSFKAIPDFLKLIAKRKSGNSGYRNTSGSSDLKPRDFPFPFVMAGNKIDLVEQRSVGSSDGAQMAYDTGGLFYECSAKTDTNVEEIFFQLIRSVAQLREAAIAHRKNPKMTNRRFLNNIGYQLSQPISSSSVSLSGVQNQSFFSRKNAQQIVNPDPCYGDPAPKTSVSGLDHLPQCAQVRHDTGLTLTAKQTTKLCCDCIIG